MKVTIIGGGVIGLCCAFYLKRQGYSIRVIDRGDITEGCSFGNMGYVSPSHFIPLASPGIISQGLKWMLSSSSPFYIKPRINWDLIRWGMNFWRNSSAKKTAQNTPPLLDLLLLSRALMNDLKEEFNNSFSMIEKGCWMLYRSDKTGDHEKHLAEHAEKLGLKTIVCDGQKVQEYEPEVEVNVKGGVLYLDDCHIDTAKFMRDMFTHLQWIGVEFWLNTEIKNFETNGKKINTIITDKNSLNCDELIIANGSWMPDTAKLLGIKLLMQPGKGYSIVYNDLEKNLHYPSILVDDRTATTPINRWLRIGGTMELSGHNDIILPKRVMAIFNAFKKYYPSIDLPEPDVKKAWYGYRPVTPDGLPYIGRHPTFSNLIFAGGHAMLGVSAAAGTGKLITEMMSETATSIELKAFNPARF